jgi:hypothetical protein
MRSWSLNPATAATEECSVGDGASDRAKASLEAEGRLGNSGSLQLEQCKRSLNLAINSTLESSGLVGLQVDDVCAGGRVRDGVTIIQVKTGRPVQFEITEQTRASIQDWL